MADFSKAVSGYDVELLFGRGFFESALKAFFESKQIPEYYEFKGKEFSCRLYLVPSYEVTIDDIDQLILGSSFALVLETPIMDFRIDDIRISFQFQFLTIRNKSGLIEGLDLKMNFYDLDAKVFDALPPEIGPFISVIKDILRQNISFTEKTSIVPGIVQSLDMKVFPQTDTSPAAVGLYVDLLLPKSPAPGDYYEPRGKNLQSAQCLLESEDEHVACAINKQVYRMLSQAIKNSFAEEIPPGSGKYEFPLYQVPRAKWNRLGSIKKISVFPPLELPKPFADLVPGYLSRNSLFISVEARCKYMSVHADVDVKISITPQLDKEGLLEWTTLVDDVDIDVDWQDFLKFPIIVFGVMSFVGAVAGGFFGMAVAGGFYTGIVVSLQSMGINMAENYVQDLLQMEVNRGAAALGMVPRRITIIHKRWDPFYVTHYQTVGALEECSIQSEGIRAYGSTTNGQEDVPYVGISPVRVVRNDIGSLCGLIYRVQEPEKIIEPQRCLCPDPARPDEFQLSLEEIETRMEQRLINYGQFLTPTHVCRRENKINYIKFDSGIYMTPYEAGMLHVKGIISVIGYKLIWVKRKGPNAFYFRAKADSRSDNNLSSLPPFNPDEEN